MAITIGTTGLTTGVIFNDATNTFTFATYTTPRNMYKTPEEKARPERRFKVGDSVKDPQRSWVGIGRVVALWSEGRSYDYVIYYPDATSLRDLHQGIDPSLDFKTNGSYRYRFYPDRLLESAVYSDGLDNWE